MQYESPAQTAERLGVTVRAIQKWAAAGKIPDAQKIGRDWRIPVTFTAPKESSVACLPDVYDAKRFRMAMPLLNSAFPVGKCKEYIASIPDEDDRAIALGEYYYFSGQAELAVQTVEPYLDSHDPALRYSASLICSFANLSRGHIHLARFALGNLKEQLFKGLKSEAPPRIQAIGIFTATTASILLHSPVPPTPPLEEYVKYLPDGLKLYACYILAHKAYLEKNYERSLAIAETGLTMCSEICPIPAIYIHLIAVMDLMSLKRVEEAKARFAMAWELARPDDLIQPIGEHHGLLQGMIEIFFQKDYPKDYERIIAITYSFSAGWRKIHNPDTQEDVADNLTTTEFTVAMLYNRGWALKEIAAHVDISERTAKKHLSTIYGKLGIDSRKELSQFMLR